MKIFNHALFSIVPALFSIAHATYPEGLDWCEYKSWTSLSVTYGPSQTVTMVEEPGAIPGWAIPTDTCFDPMGHPETLIQYDNGKKNCNICLVGGKKEMFFVMGTTSLGSVMGHDQKWVDNVWELRVYEEGANKAGSAAHLAVSLEKAPYSIKDAGRIIISDVHLAGTLEQGRLVQGKVEKGFFMQDKKVYGPGALFENGVCTNPDQTCLDNLKLYIRVPEGFPPVYKIRRLPS